MTRLYEWKPIPHCVDVVCPNCRRRAEFEFAEVVRIERRADVEYFLQSRQFEYREFRDSCGHGWHAAVYFQGLHGSPQRALQDLPAGYTADQWAHPQHLQNRKDWPVGSIRCGSCHLRRQHELAWPAEAYYAVPYRSQVLWAFHREMAVELMQYLQSTERNQGRYRWGYFMNHLPTLFKVSKSREGIVRKLGQLLELEPIRLFR